MKCNQTKNYSNFQKMRRKRKMNQNHFFQFKNKKQIILKNQNKLINTYNSNKIFKTILKLRKKQIKNTISVLKVNKVNQMIIISLIVLNSKNKELWTPKN